MKKRLASVILMLSMVISLIPLQVYAAYSQPALEAVSEAVSVFAAPVPEGGEIITEERSFDPYGYITEGFPEMRGMLFAKRGESYDAKSGYGGQLTDQQKQVYDALVSYYIDSSGRSVVNPSASMIFTPESISFTGDSSDALFFDISRGYFAFVYDYPTAFWAGGLNTNISYSQTGSLYTLSNATLTITEQYSGARAAVAKYNSGVNSAVQSIYNSVSAGSSVSAYYRAIHDWVCNNITYNDEAYANSGDSNYKYAYSSGSVFTGNPSVVCEGYGETFKVLCDQMRMMYGKTLYCAEIIGTSAKKKSHMWNYVLLTNGLLSDGRWYAVDTTWDDQNAIKYTYFLCGSASEGADSSITFSEEHLERSDFMLNSTVKFIYPSLNISRYWENSLLNSTPVYDYSFSWNDDFPAIDAVLNNGNLNANLVIAMTALSNLSYDIGGMNGKGYICGYSTVSDFVNYKYNRNDNYIWESKRGFRTGEYTQLYGAFVGNYIIQEEDRDDTLDYYAVCFKTIDSDNVDRYIISYRGTAGNGGVLTDAQFAVRNFLNGQFDRALEFYQKINLRAASTNRNYRIILTGHSLGGALSTYVSLTTGARAFTVDGANGHVFDTTIWQSYLDVSGFAGIDKFNFVNFTDEIGKNALADAVSTQHKGHYPMITFKCVHPSDAPYWQPFNDIAGPHHPFSYLDFDVSNYKYILGEVVETFNGSSKWYHDIRDMGLPLGRVWFGTSGNDDIPGSYANIQNNNRIFGGMGKDIITGGAGTDIISISGSGSILDGQGGSDTYIIDLKSGSAYINDPAGMDVIILNGWNDVTIKRESIQNMPNSGYITLSEGGDGRTVYINCSRCGGSNNAISVYRIAKYFTGRASENMIKVCSDLMKESQKSGTRSVLLSNTKADDGSETLKMIKIDGIASFSVFDSDGNQLSSDVVLTNRNGDNVKYTDYAYFYGYNNSIASYSILYIFNNAYSVVVQSENSILAEISRYSENEVVYTQRTSETVVTNGEYINIIASGLDAGFYIVDSSDNQTKIDNISETVYPDSVLLSESEITLLRGEAATLSFFVAPNDSDSEGEWSTENPYVAEVSNGSVLAIGGGNTEVHYTTRNGKSASCKVIVPRNNIIISFVSDDGSGETFTKSIIEGEMCILPDCPFSAPAGKQFEGWLSEGVTYSAGITWEFKESTTLIAQWEDEYDNPTPQSEVINKYGTLSTGLNWAINDSGVLSLAGTNSIPNFDGTDGAPWYPYANEITSLSISVGITSIGEYAFAKLTGLTEVSIPETVEEIHSSAFQGCTSLESLTMPFIGTSRTASGENGVLGALFGTISEGGVTQYNRLDDNHFYGYSYAIPATLKSVTITDATQIPFGAFYNCSNLEEITLNEGIQSISGYAFANCSALETLAIPNSVQTIAASALSGCDAIEELSIPFIGSSRDAHETADAVIGHIFGYDASGTMQYYSQAETNGSISLSGNSYAIPASLITITVTDATQIPLGAFFNCGGLIAINLNEGITQIGNFAFAHCGGLKTLTIPKSVTTLPSQALINCDALESLTIPFVGASRDASGANGVLGYPFGTASERTMQYIGETDTSLLGRKFDIPVNLNSVTVTDATQLSFGAFSNVASITQVSLNKGITSIGKYAFSGCSELKDVSYSGTQEDWNNIQKGDNNEALAVASIHCTDGDLGTEPQHTHSLTGTAAKAATCEADGNIAYWTCSGCGKLFSDMDGKNEITQTNTVVKALGHDWGAWTVTTPATETTDGVETRTCTRDASHTETRAITKLTYTVGFVANGGTGTMDAVPGISGSYTLPACGFTAPEGKTFQSWSVQVGESTAVTKAAGDTITVTANTTVTATWTQAGHDHSFTYSATGATITATCSSAGCPLTNNKAALTITAPASLTYDGTSKAATISGDTSLLGTPTITYTKGGTPFTETPTDAGAYTASITLGEGNGVTTSSISYTITPKSLTGAAVTLDKTQLQYTGSSQSVNVTGVTLDGKALVSTDYTVSGNTGTNKDSYTVTVTGKGNYKDTATVDWSITEKPMTVTASNVTATYDGKAHGISVSVTDPASGATIRYGNTANACTLTVSPTITDAGSLTVYYKVTAANYSDYIGSAVITINKKEVGLIWQNTSLVYNGSAQAPTATATGLVTSDTVSVTVTGVQTNAGTGYTATASALTGSKAENYNLPSANTTTFAIAKADGLAAPNGLKGVAPTTDSGKDGRITGVTTAMEYSTNSGFTTKTTCSGTEITGLTAGTYYVRMKETANQKAGSAATVTVPAYTAPATYTLSVTAPTFDTVTAGYTQPAAKALTIKSTGNSSATITGAVLSGTGKDAFTLTNGTASVTAGGTNTSYSIRPKAGLAVGTYTATITVTYNGGASTTASVSFQVNAVPLAYNVQGEWNGSKLNATVTVPANASALLLAASYNDNGRLADIKIITIQANKTTYDTGLTKASGYTYKLMLVNASTYAPLCEAWSKAE